MSFHNSSANSILKSSDLDDQEYEERKKQSSNLARVKSQNLLPMNLEEDSDCDSDLSVGDAPVSVTHMRVVKEFEPKHLMLSLNKSNKGVVIVSHTNPVSPPSNSFLKQPVRREADMKAKS